MVRTPLPATGYGYVGTANIGAARSLQLRTIAMQKLHNHYPGNWSFQEIDQGDVGNELAALHGVFWDYTVIDHDSNKPDVLAHHVPTAARRRFWGTDHNQFVYYGHGAIEGMWPVAPILLTLHWARKFNATYVQLNGQPVGWDGPDWRVRHRHWDAWFSSLRYIVQDQVGFWGYTVIVAIDANRFDVPSINRNENRYVERGSSIISVIEPNPGYRGIAGIRTAVDLVGVNHIALDIDGHPAHRAHLRFHHLKD